MSHEERRSRVLIRAVELFDHDQAGLGLRDDLADAAVKLAQAFFERSSGRRYDDAGLNQPDAAVRPFDGAVAGSAQRRIDSENANRGRSQGGGVPLTVTATEEPGASAVPAVGCVPITLPPAPTVVVYCHCATE